MLMQECHMGANIQSAHLFREEKNLHVQRVDEDVLLFGQMRYTLVLE